MVLVDDRSQIDGLVQTIRGQSFEAWQLWFVCLGDKAGTFNDALRGEAYAEPRLHVVGATELSWQGNSWMPPGEGDYIVLLDGQAVLTPNALSHVVEAIRQTGADWIYTDDDRLDQAGRPCDPNLKGDFSPELALVDDYATRLAVARRGMVATAGGLRGEYGEAQIYDLLLRIVACGGRIQHLAEVGCHRLHSSAAVLGPQHRLAAERALLAATEVQASVEVGRCASPANLDVPRVKWPDRFLESSRVTIVIPTRDRVDLLHACVESLRRTVNPDRARLLIVDDHSEHATTHRYFRDLEGDPQWQCRVLHVGRADEGFNYSRLMNAASREVDTPLTLHLNNDVEAMAPGWLDQMAGWFSFKEIGVVGAKLLYPDDSIQHAGVLVAPWPSTPGHLFCRLSGNDDGYQWLPHRVRNVSAVTGACLLTRTSLFRELGGFDEQHLPVQFNDIDYCVKVIGAGQRIVYEPAAILRHDASSSRGSAYRLPRE